MYGNITDTEPSSFYYIVLDRMNVFIIQLLYVRIQHTEQIITHTYIHTYMHTPYITIAFMFIHQPTTLMNKYKWILKSFKEFKIKFNMKTDCKESARKNFVKLLNCIISNILFYFCFFFYFRVDFKLYITPLVYKISTYNISSVRN